MRNSLLVLKVKLNIPSRGPQKHPYLYSSNSNKTVSHVYGTK